MVQISLLVYMPASLPPELCWSGADVEPRTRKNAKIHTSRPETAACEIKTKQAPQSKYGGKHWPNRIEVGGKTSSLSEHAHGVPYHLVQN